MELLERNNSLNQLSDLLRLATTRQGRAVLISGEAGIGKTALVEKFTHLHSDKTRLLWGACEDLFTPRPLGPLYDIATQTQGSLSTLLGQDVERSTLFSAFLEELQKSPIPTIVVFEDVHWADEATLDLIKLLGRRLSHLSVLFLITYRENELRPDHPLWSVIGDLPGYAVSRLRLTPLSPQTVTCLAQQAHHQGNTEQLYTVTGGNPFFVTEVLASETPGVPLMVRDAVLTRITRLSPGARALLELASVIPTRTERWLLDAILNSPDEVVEECLTSGMLTLVQTAIAFRHELARQAVESALSPLRKQALHAQVLHTLLTREEDATRAAHLVHHALGANNGALVSLYAPIAARQASAQGAHREAAAHYATALLEACRFPLERQAELLGEQAYECYLTSQIKDAVQARQAALRIWQQLDRTDQVGQTLLWLSRLNWYLGTSDEAERFAVEAVHLLETLPPDGRLAMAYSNRAHLAMLADTISEVVYWSERAMMLAESLGDEETLVHSLNNLGTALLTSQDEQGRAYLERSLQLALKLGREEDVARAFTNLACCAIKVHDYPGAEHLLKQGLDYCTEHDLDACGMYLEAWQARASFEQGHWDAAAEKATHVLSPYQLSTAIKIPALMVLGALRVRRGDPGSIPVLEEAHTLALATRELQRIVPVAAARAEAAWLRGNLEECLTEARTGYDLALTHTDPWNLGELSLWMWRAGGLAEAPGPIAEPFAHQLAGDWHGAATLWAQLGCPYEQALALIEGDAEAMRSALEIFEQLGAQPAAALVRRRLRQQGIGGIPRGPRLSTRTNQAGLTSRQWEVLQLMVEGLPNTEIANRLFTSSKTIEHHISAVFAKLGAHSRAQAIRVAYQMELIPKIGKPEA